MCQFFSKAFLPSSLHPLQHGTFCTKLFRAGYWFWRLLCSCFDFHPFSPFPAFLYVILLITGAGADFVMLGGMFAGHDQCAGEIMEKNGKKVKLFYGMSSDTAMKKHAGGVAEYRYEFHTGAIAVSQPSGNFWSRIVQKACVGYRPMPLFPFTKLLPTLIAADLREGWHRGETGRRSWGDG